jgi:hypothetical protein
MPGSRLKRSALQLLVDTLNPLTFYAFVFYLTVFGLARQGLPRFLVTVGLLLLANVLEVGIKLLLKSNLSKEGFASVRPRSASGLHSLAIKALLRSRASMVVLCVGYIFKGLILVVIGYGVARKPSIVDAPGLISIMMTLIISPILPFNYLFNNLWGYLTSVWLVLVVSGGWKKRAYVYSLLLLIVVLPDLLISLAFLVTTRLPFYRFMFLYLLCLFLFIPAGLIFSTQFPRRIRKDVSFESMKSNTSFAASLVLMLMALSSSLLINWWTGGGGWTCLAIGVSEFLLLIWLTVYVLKQSISKCYKKLY